MLRSNWWSGGLAVMVIGLAWWLPGARTDPPGGKVLDNQVVAVQQGASGKAAAATLRPELLERKLATTITFEFDPGPLKEALEALSDKYSLPLLVDTEAFKTDLQVADVESQQVKFAKVPGLRLETVLEKLLGQVGGGYLVKGDHLEITTLQRVQTAIWGMGEQVDEGGPGRPRPRLPVVHEAIEKKPLEDALQELADATGTSIVLDQRRAGDKARKPVTAPLHNVPLDTAVRLLASQAELQALLMDNVLYVTTPDHARDVQPDGDGLAALYGREIKGDAGTSFQFYRQLRQPVHLKLDAILLETALQQLGREMNLNVVLDKQVSKEGQTPITLNLKDVSVETAVRLLAEMAGLKAVLIGNVVLVTTEAKANKLDADLKKVPPEAAAVMGVNTGIGAGIIGLAGGSGGGNLGIMGFGGGYGGALGFSGGTWPSAGTSKVITGGRPGVGAPSGEAPAPPDRKVDAPAPKKTVNRAGQLGAILARPITLEKGLDEGPLKDALHFISDRNNLPILIDEEAFKSDLQVGDVESQSVKLPKMTGIRLRVVLNRLVAQVGGRYLIKADHVEITTAQRVKAAVWGLSEPDEEGRQRPLLALLHTTFDRRPLTEALRVLTETTGTSIIVDERRAGDRAKIPVTAGLNNVPMDTAVFLLADQAGLEAVLLDNAFYVTTPEQARTLRMEQQKANQRGFEPTAAPNPNAGAQ